jgi:hypothetical protein
MKPAIPRISQIRPDTIAIHQLRGTPDGGEASFRQGVCSPAQASRVVALLAELREDEQSRCHTPGFRVDMLQGDETVFSAAICWSCSNMSLSGRLAPDKWATFNAESPAAKELLALCEGVVNSAPGGAASSFA